MIILLDILYFLLSIVYIPYLFVNGKLHLGFFMRLGIWPKGLKSKIKGKQNIWVHAVSVGEVLAVVPMIKALKEKYPDHQIIITTVTQTGYKVANSKFQDAVVLYAPLDFGLTVFKYVRRINPELYITAETEIWPNLFLTLHRKKVPIILVNGRISDKSFVRYQRLSFLIKKILGCVSIFLMQSQQDADRIIELGASPDKVKIIGNMKFDDLPQEIEFSISDLGFNHEEDLWIAGSTHPGEEEALLDVYKEISKEYPKLRFILVPRHIERSDDIAQVVIEKGLAPVKFTHIQEKKVDNNSIVIVDTIGHLRSLYSLAKVVFVGKSLTGWGGQNVIEPAFFGKPIIVGPNMQNFKDIMDLFLQKRAILQVANQDGVYLALKRILGNPSEMKSIGQRAKEVIDECRGSTDKTIKVIEEVLQ